MEEEKLLRTLKAVIAISLLSPTAGQADDQSELKFAPGAQGAIQAPIDDILNRAARDGRRLLNSIDVQKPNSYGTKTDFSDLRRRALSDPRVQKLLNVQGGDQAGDEDQRKYGSQKAFLFLSFSMPRNSLRQALEESERFGMPVVFRGFVNSSVLDTQKALEDVFGEDLNAVGFSIDPTMYTRFSVEVVPTLVVLTSELTDCVSPGCAAEAIQPHDKISGNVPIEAALEIIAEGDGHAAEQANDILERARK